jgi:hypothetical protein
VAGGGRGPLLAEAGDQVALGVVELDVGVDRG